MNKKHMPADERLVADITARLKDHEVHIFRVPDKSPRLEVTVPDSWPHIVLAPWYDVHLGNNGHLAARFDKDINWFLNEPYTLGWLGGDIMENATKLSVGTGVYHQDYNPQNQMALSLQKFADVRHKLLFSIPGNHEDRTGILGIDPVYWVAQILGIEYSPDYMFARFKWRGQYIDLLAHHGVGASRTAGAQRMMVRRLAEIGEADIYWVGHLHNELTDKWIKGRSDFNSHGHMSECLGIISPAYLDYFKSYAAQKMLPPSTTGLTTVKIFQNDEGEIRCDKITRTHISRGR